MKLNLLSKFVRKCTSEINNQCANDKVKLFNKIPGPKGILHFGTLLYYTRLIGIYNWDTLHETGLKKQKKYGNIVREKMLPGVYVVWLFDPNDIATVLSDSPGHYPERRSHLALQHYRESRADIYRTGGLLPTNGSQWGKLRSKLQKSLSSPAHVRNFLPLADQVTINFVDQFNTTCEHHDFIEELERLNLELTCFLAFDIEMNSFSVIERDPKSRTSKLMKAAEVTNESILPTDQGFPWWRIFETSPYKNLRTSQEYMESIAIDLVKQKNTLVSSTKPKSLFDIYLSNPDLDMRDIIGMACDFLLAGVHTTSYATSFALYHIITNKHVQQRLYEEARSNMQSKSSPITANILNNIPYTRAVLKESFRLNPISIGVGRILTREMILSGYKVPEGTVVVTQNLIACQLEEHFHSPNCFIPERWLKHSRNEETGVNPYLVLPFGHGMRSCIARRLAEQNMLILLLRLFRNYELEWIGSDHFPFQTKLINKPTNKLKIKFHPR